MRKRIGQIWDLLSGWGALLAGVLGLVATVYIAIAAIRQVISKWHSQDWVIFGVIILILALGGTTGVFVYRFLYRYHWFRRVVQTAGPWIWIVSGLVQMVAALVGVIQGVLGTFPHSSPANIWARDVQPLLVHGTLLDFIKAAGLIILGAGVGIVGLVVIPSRAARWLMRKPLGLLTLPALRSLAQFFVTVADLVVIGGLLYACYRLGLFPRTAASDLFVTAAGATAIKIGVSAAILLVKGIVGGVGSYVGYRAAKSVAAAHGDSEKGDSAKT